MNWYSLERVWRSAGQKNQVKVRFNDWTHHIKFFEIQGESTDGRRLVGVLDSGEKISFSKVSQGWTLYQAEDEYQAHAV